ncbi:MAG: carbon-nitrogen hydrolase [Pseudomonadota bacterium]
MSANVLTAAAVQMSPSDDREDNLKRALALCAEAADRGARLIVLPELFLGHYFCQRPDAAQFARAQPIPGPATEALGQFAAERDVAIVASLFERRAPGLYHNTVAVLDGARGLVGTYRKMHIPDDPGYGEKFYFTPGDQGFRTFDLAGARVGTLICWDQWFPEAARLTALRGADILVYPTAIGWHPYEKESHGAAQHDAWRTIQRSHAIANGCFVMAVNRAGFEPAPDGDSGIEFWGQSFVAGPDGQVLCEAPAAGESVLVAELNLDHIREQREGWPFLRDRRIDAYGALTRRYLDDPSDP